MDAKILSVNQQPSLAIDRSLSYSVSPTRFDGTNIMRDLHEMSDYADRIDSILDQQEERATSSRSISPAYYRSASKSPTPRNDYFVGEDNDDDDDDEVD